MQRILLGVIAVAAVAGWITAFYALRSSGDVKERLTATRAELSAVSEKLTNTQTRLRLQQDAAGSLEEIGERIGSVQAEAATLTRQIKTKTSELQALQQKTAADGSHCHRRRCRVDHGVLCLEKFRGRERQADRDQGGALRGQ